LWYNAHVAQPASTSLLRTIGRWSLAALTINSIIGSGVFGLPSVVAGLTAAASPWAVLLAGAAVGIIMACFAEVASQFSEAGGPYLYARATFGQLAGIETGWMLWLARLTAPAANANLFVIYLGEFWPHANNLVPRFLILTLLVGILAAINLRGVRAGVQVSNITTLAKLIPLIVVAVAGVFFLMTRQHPQMTPQTTATAHAWLKAMLLLVFAYGGFEAALTPMGEAKDPKRDVAFGLFVALITCTALYFALQWAVVGLLPNPAQSERPLADVARLMFGNWGAAFITVGALISVYGYLGANLLAVPRITFALAERGDFPKIFSAVHHRFRTPHFSILLFAALVWLLALLGSFSWNLTLSAVARLFYYGLVCAALPVLRQRQPDAAMFRLLGGNVLAVIGVLICLVLMTQVDPGGAMILLALLGVAFLNWLWARKKTVTEPPTRRGR
jgi:APA family basic amino acid/polyamine antiporter